MKRPQRAASGDEKKVKHVLTYGAVRPCPVGITDAGSRVRVEGAVIGTLLRTSAFQDLAADPSPAWVTVALTMMTGSMTGAQWVQAIH